MRCRNCGQILENGSRFCTYCDCDNYPEMNRVKTKSGTHHEVSARTTYKPIQNNLRQPKNTQSNKAKKKNSGLSILIIFFIIAYILFALITGNAFD